MSIIAKEEAARFAKAEIDDLDEEEQKWLDFLIASAETYLKNATGKEYPKEIEGVAQAYPLEKLYCGMLISHWYDNPDLIGSTGSDFNNMVKSLMLQLKV